MLKCIFAVAILAGCLSAQGRFPLESVSIEGTSISREAVLAISGLRLGAPLDKEQIETACKQLGDSGLFASVNYKYAPGPKHGYAVTLALEDPSRLAKASIDLPGVDSEKIWQWLQSLYPAFNQQVPMADSAQQFLARQIEEHTRDSLRGQHITVRMEGLGSTLVSFQPEVLPRVASMTFTGQHEISESDLQEPLRNIMAQQGYLDRTYKEYIDLNLRPLYERHGMYRVRFSTVAGKIENGSVSVATDIEEGPKFTLGDVQFIGDSLPVSAMTDAADFKAGRLANWAAIQTGIDESEKCLKRTGYYQAKAVPERVFDDNKHVLSLRIAYNKGPLFRVGEVQFVGLSPDQLRMAKSAWAAHTGQPFDYQYPNAFRREFFQNVDYRSFKKYSDKIAIHRSEPVVDITMVFEPK